MPPFPGTAQGKTAPARATGDPGPGSRRPPESPIERPSRTKHPAIGRESHASCPHCTGSRRAGPRLRSGRGRTRPQSDPCTGAAGNPGCADLCLSRAQHFAAEIPQRPAPAEGAPPAARRLTTERLATMPLAARGGRMDLRHPGQTLAHGRRTTALPQRPIDLAHGRTPTRPASGGVSPCGRRRGTRALHGAHLRKVHDGLTSDPDRAIRGRNGDTGHKKTRRLAGLLSRNTA